MFTDPKIEKYTVQEDQTVGDVINLFERSAESIAVCVDENNRPQGVFTNGDLLRLLLERKETAFQQPITEVMNRDFVVAKATDSERQKRRSLDRVKYLPIVNEQNRLVGVTRRPKPVELIDVNGLKVSKNDPCFVIAEIGNNHNGSMELGKKLIDLAKQSGADCAKFQMRDMNSLYVNAGSPDDASADLGTQYTLDLLNKFDLPHNKLFELFDYAKSIGITPFCTPWDLTSLQRLKDYGMTAIKVSSADMTNHDLLRAAAELEMNMILSTGMSTENELVDTVKVLSEAGANYALLHCNSTYPAPFADINLGYMPKLKEIGHCLIGYSGHERGIEVPIAAVAMGAKIVEKHFTTDKSMEGNDHKVSLLPEEFKLMVQSIRNVEASIGSSDFRSISQGEMINRVTLGKSLVASKNLKVGDLLTEDMLEVRSPGKGLQPYRKKQLIGVKLDRDMKKGDFFYETDISGRSGGLSQFEFPYKFGIPVRYHDFKALTNLGIQLDFVEFHYSYKDLDLDPRQFLEKNEGLEFIVHSPELFEGEHILDLCSTDEKYRLHSISELNRVAERAGELREFFPKTKNPMIVTNVGGFTKHSLLSEKEKKQRYEILADSLSRLNLGDCEILPQTMPPFPWHFGGQSHHNLFVKPEEIVEFCKAHKMRICYDTSHSALACNHLGLSFEEFSEAVMPYTCHLHVSDAKGSGQEGLQIFEG
ncbi:MAG: N-acetylneuraminate synthase family protein, partial [Pseudomonadota bacterium]